MKLSFARQTGKNHMESGRACEDSVDGIREGALCVAALSDGAGSKPLAGECSELLVRLTLDYFQEDISRVSSFDADSFLRYILDGVAEQGLTPGTAGATLLFYAMNEECYACGHIGDGVILMKNVDEDFLVFSEPENGEYINQTYFIPSEDAECHFRARTGPADKVDCVIMTSDGVSDMLYQLDTRIPAPVCGTMRRLAAQLSEEEFCEALEENLRELFSQYTGDDMSVAVISR